MYNQIQPSQPGKWINCGGTGIGWSNGAALGVNMALDDLRNANGQEGEIPSTDLVCQVVGDGSFMCAAPSSALWIGSKCRIPTLTVVLNNGGWKAPSNSTKIVHPTGLAASGAMDDELNISFRPSPNYAALAKAAAGGGEEKGEGTEHWMKGVRVKTVGELKEALECAKSRLIASEGRKGILIGVLM